MAIGLDNALLGWLVGSAGNQLVARLRADPAQAVMKTIVGDAVTAVVDEFHDLDSAAAEHLRACLLNQDPITDDEQVRVTSAAELRDALRRWTTALDRPEFGEPGYLRGRGIDSEELAGALADRIIEGIRRDGRRGGVLGPLADWFWRDSVDAKLAALGDPSAWQFEIAGGRAMIEQAVPAVTGPGFQTEQDSEPGSVSVEPPWGRLPERLHGRAFILENLVRSVANPRDPVVVLHAAGGYGKSALALWVARRASDEGVTVWWVSAADGVTLTGGLREVALQAGANPTAVALAWSGRASAPDLLWRTLNARQERWLLVVDNADDSHLLAAGGGQLADGTGWLRRPRTGRGSVLVTSRQGNARVWPPGSVLHQVTTIDKAAAGQALLDLAGARAGSLHDAERLGARLGGLPLALHLAGRYLGAAHETLRLPGLDLPGTFAQYHADLDRHIGVLDEMPPGNRGDRDERELITRTWELSLELLAQRGYTLARPLLRLLSCLGQAPVPVDMLDARVLAGVEGWSEITPGGLAELLHVLSDLGLIDRVDTGQHQAVALHQLIRDANRHHISREPHLEHYAEALVALTDRPSPVSRQVWRQAFASHAQEVLEFCSQHGDQLTPTTMERAAANAERSLNTHINYGRYRQARDVGTAILQVRQRVLREDHPDTLTIRTTLATLRSEGELGAAIAELEAVLELQRRTLGDEDIDTLNTLHKLAGVLLAKGDVPAAEAVYRATLAAARQTLGEDHLGTLALWTGLGHSLASQGRLAEAETELRAALDAHRRVLGDEYRGTAATWLDLANLLASRGRLVAAEREYRALVALCHKLWGEDAEDTLAARHGLALTLRRLDRNAEARDEYRAVLDIARPTRGEEHAGVLTCRANLAVCVAILGDVKSAKAELRDVLAIQRRVYGEDHPSTQATKRDLAAIRFTLPNGPQPPFGRQKRPRR